jgi:hypothetical protein
MAATAVGRASADCHQHWLLVVSSPSNTNYTRGLFIGRTFVSLAVDSFYFAAASCPSFSLCRVSSVLVIDVLHSVAGGCWQSRCRHKRPTSLSDDEDLYLRFLCAPPTLLIVRGLFFPPHQAALLCRCDVDGQDNTHVEGHSFDAIATPVGRAPFPPFHRLLVPAGSMPRHYTSRPFPTDLALEAEHAPVHQRLKDTVHSYGRRMEGIDETRQLMIRVTAGDRCCLAGIVSFFIEIVLLGALSRFRFVGRLSYSCEHWFQ